MSDPGLELREAVAADAAALVDLHQRIEPDGAPLPVEHYQAGCESEAPSARLVALWDGQVVGAAAFQPAWWTGQPGVYAVDLHVHPTHRRRGVGSRLYARSVARLRECGAHRLVVWIRADCEPGRRFAARHGFSETGQVVQDYRLHLPATGTHDYAGVEDRLTREGLRVRSLAELGREDVPFLSALQRLWAGCEDASSDLGVSLAQWREEVLAGAGLSPETHWVALCGDAPIGMTFLQRLSDTAYENDYTGVAPVYRGRGIATALKVRALTWGREHGVEWFYTSSEVGNAPMIALNTRLGYTPGPRRVEMAAYLEEGSSSADR